MQLFRDENQTHLYFSDNNPRTIGRVSLEKFSEQECVTIKSLQNYYQKLGFKKVPETAYMILDLELKRPNLKNIGFRN